MQGVVYKDLIAPGMEVHEVASPEVRESTDRSHFQNPNAQSSTVNASRGQLDSSQPTASHALAKADPNQKGHAQIDHGGDEVKDLGWHEDADDIPAPLVGGLPNEELWVLIRRFNKMMYHVKVRTDYHPIEGN